MCRICKREYQNARRRDHKVRYTVKEFEELRRSLLDLFFFHTVDHPATKAAFIHKLGPRGTCILRNHTGLHPIVKPRRVVALAFQPGGWVTVEDEDNDEVVLTVPLADLDPDDRKPETRPQVTIKPSEMRDIRILAALIRNRPVSHLIQETPASAHYKMSLKDLVANDGIGLPDYLKSG